MMDADPIILASGSPRRRELLAEAGIAFEVIPAGVEEIDDAPLPPEELTAANAQRKARHVAAAHPGRVVLGADTLVFLEGEPLTKPRDLGEAFQMVRRLAGRAHQVCTAVALCLAEPARERLFHAITEVRFKPLTDDEIRAYHRLIDPLDKAGAYAAQEHGDAIIAGYDGSWTNVVGLPMEGLAEELRAFRAAASISHP